MTIDYKLIRHAMSGYFDEGICPTDPRQPISEELGVSLVQELIDSNICCLEILSKLTVLAPAIRELP